MSRSIIEETRPGPAREHCKDLKWEGVVGKSIRVIICPHSQHAGIATEKQKVQDFIVKRYRYVLNLFLALASGSREGESGYGYRRETKAGDGSGN